jgi:hypothetical protein
MPISLTIQVTDNATPALAAILAENTPENLAGKIGPKFASLMQQHLVSNGPNKQGGPSTNFWARAAQATTWATAADGVTVSINQAGVRQRLLGGTIAPTNAQALAIPISPLSYGRTPRDFAGLFLLAIKKGAYLVQTTGGTAKSGKRKGSGRAAQQIQAGLTFLFKLADQVYQNPDPTVIPTAADFMEAARAHFQEAAV